jgi:hypothetical protein
VNGCYSEEGAPMSEDSTTPHESDSHASEDSKAAEVKEESMAETAASDQSASEILASESTSAQEGASEPLGKPPREPILVAVEASGNRQTFDKALKLAKDAWAKAQPVLKEKGTQALLVANRWTNHFLDETWPNLSNLAIAKIPDSTKAKVAEQKAKLQPILDKLQPLWAKVAVPFWQKVVVPAWNKGLAFLRQKLPANLQELTDRFLTVAIIAITVAIYWFFSSLTSGKPAVAKQPPVPSKPVLTRPAPRPMAQRPTVQPSSAPAIAKPKVASPRPVAPATRPTATPKVAPSPAIDLAGIQTQLGSEVAGIGEGLVASIKTADADRQLKVYLDPSWDGLSAADQGKVAQKLWARSQKLTFDRFELLDSTNTLVARSPVVGSNVVILKKPASDAM